MRQVGVSRQRRWGCCSSVPYLCQQRDDRLATSVNQRCDVTPGTREPIVLSESKQPASRHPTSSGKVDRQDMYSRGGMGRCPNWRCKTAIVDEGKKSRQRTPTKAKPIVGETQWEMEEGS